MNPVKSERSNCKEAVLPMPQAIVNQSNSQPVSSNPPLAAGASTDTITPSSVPDLKLIYFNKPDGDLKPSALPIGNGVAPKVVQLPNASGTSGGFAYLGTIIKQGKDSSEGQKVLLTPVIKDGGRFILPRGGGSQRPAVGGTVTSSAGQIILSQSQSQQSRRSFLIHNSALSSKEIKTSKDNNAVVPKVLPPPKVPLVVCASRPHDVTLTSVKPLAVREDLTPPRQQVDVASLMSPHRDSSGQRDIPPLTPFNPSSLSPTPTAAVSDNDDVELVGDGDMPRPIINKQPLKTKTESFTVVLTQSATSPSSIQAPSPNICSPIKIDDSPPSSCEPCPLSSLDHKDKDNVSDKSDDLIINCKDILDKSLANDETVHASDISTREDNPATEVNEKPSETSSENNKTVSCIIQSVNNDVNLKRSKNDLPNIKLTNSNGHFVRILSACAGSDPRDISSKHGINTVFLKDGKAVVVGNLSKELTVKDSKELLAKEYKELISKDASFIKDRGVIDGQDENTNAEVNKKSESINTTSTLVTIPKLVQKSFPISGTLTHVQSHQEAAKIGLCSVDKQEDSVSPKPMFNARGLSTLPGVIANSQVKESGLQVKELSKENAMLERTRKRKGAPLLRDCFKKTIAVKRLEPLTGASSFEPLQVIDWDQKSRVGTLPGSDIKFVVNSYGALQVYEGEGLKNTNTKPIGGMDVVYCPADSAVKDEIGKCIECECYGLLVEFIEEKFCSLSCRERNHTRKALITKRTLAITKETSKKRKLLEIALNKTRPSEDENCKSRPILPKADKIAKHSELKTPQKDKTECRNDKKTSQPMEVETIQPEPKIKVETPPSVEPCAKQSENSSNSTNAKSDCSNPSKSIRPNDVLKTFPKLVHVSEPLKIDQPPVAPTSEDKKAAKERRQSIECSMKSAATNTVETVVERKPIELFDWCEYLSQMRSHPAWIRLFKDAFPAQPNLFKVGHRLEAIDPQRPSLFCAVSVAQVKGYRLKLHFDGYGKVHDFWLNADSPNIFPCGFCHSHGIELEPPWGFNKESFNWSQYLTNIKAKAAPPKCFIHKLMDTGEPNLFKVGMKLEAVDKKNSYLVCVATVAAVVDHRILVHFDSWDDSYDYWTEYYSPNIHPVGWCQRNNYTLTPPNGQRKKNFSWRRYLVETGSEAAPDAAFMVRPPIKFKKGSKLEAVDPRAPHILRVATIKQILPYQVHVVFDGFPDHFGYWFDDDSPDLHPIGWGTRTGHPLTPPPKPTTIRHCGTAGCHGDGNASSGDLEAHDNITDCPYSMDNLEEDNILPDRLAPRKSWNNNNKIQQQTDIRKDNIVGSKAKRIRDPDITNELSSGSSMLVSVENVESSSTPTSNVTVSLSDFTSSSDCTTTSTVVADPEPPETKVPLSPKLSPPLLPASTPSTNQKPKDDPLKAACDKFVSKISIAPTSSSEVEARELLEWDSRKVTAFTESLLHKATNAFYDNKVDGEGFLMLSEDDLFRRLNFNQLEASTIYNNIVTLRTKFALHLH